MHICIVAERLACLYLIFIPNIQCVENNPCFEPETCIDAPYGFICPRCPSGYHGGVYRGYDASIKQVMHSVGLLSCIVLRNVPVLIITMTVTYCLFCELPQWE